MKFQSIKIPFLVAALANSPFFPGAAHLWGAPKAQTEIQVTLLGQPCRLQGPVNEETLRAVHDIGPAQIYPVALPSNPKHSAQEIRDTLEKIKKMTNLPHSLDRYRTQLMKRLDAQILFWDGLVTEKSGRSTQALLNLGKRVLAAPDLKDPKDFKKFEILLSKLDNQKGTAQYRDSVEQLYDLYNEGIAQDPEEEFHRAIKKLGIQFNCAFDDAEDPTTNH